ncbi:hypothetical protein [Phytomonospora endophytica]|uniref:Uncharacterized protein n=1 Tax=Phytomonospora endophytica TaxID=714109 RepID=A0A841FXU0_9ACTN|nr:hypothetical protein [Phytomonospora endophytica]MBB6038538.1 hypothetical protein [Phytomonospora endophytica]GIG69322.1 hypothetical protein Pen01_56170 [Phytomonospora endophytica]
MYTTSRACIACRRTHPHAHDRGCLNIPAPHITKGTTPAIGVERWWLAAPPEAAGRLSDRLCLSEVMSGVTWQTRERCPVPAALAGLSACLEDGFWCLTGWATPSAPRVMAPYELLALRHHQGSAVRVFWLAAHEIVAHVFAIDLSTRRGHQVAKGGGSDVAAAA